MVSELEFDRGAAAHARWAGFPASSRLSTMADCAHSAPELRLTVAWVFVHYVLRLLAIIWFHATRLETRTKESNMYASWWVENP